MTANEPKVLIIDNNIDLPLNYCSDFRRQIPNGTALVRRAPNQDLPENIETFSHIVISGSRTSVHDESEWVLKLLKYIERICASQIPLLGVCYGHQMIAKTFGGKNAVRTSQTPEFGWVEISKTKEDLLLKGLPDKFISFQAHREEVSELPTGFIKTSESPRCDIQSYYVKNLPIFGVQFHPERNQEEGDIAIQKNLKTVPKDCIFGHLADKPLFNKQVATHIFSNFLAVTKKK